MQKPCNSISVSVRGGNGSALRTESGSDKINSCTRLKSETVGSEWRLPLDCLPTTARSWVVAWEGRGFYLVLANRETGVTPAGSATNLAMASHICPGDSHPSAVANPQPCCQRTPQGRRAWLPSHHFCIGAKVSRLVTNAVRLSRLAPHMHAWKPWTLAGYLANNVCISGICYIRGRCGFPIVYPMPC